MNKVAGAFLCIEDDIVIGEMVLSDWRNISEAQQFDRQIIFLKGTREVVNGLTNQRAFSNLGGERRMLWIKNRKVTNNDATFLILLLNMVNEPPKNRYFLYMENFNEESLQKEDLMGWNARYAFDWKVRDNLKLDFFVDFESLILEYDLSDWLASSIREAVNRFSLFFNKICLVLGFVDKSWPEKKLDNKSRVVFQDLRMQAKSLKSEWNILMSACPYIASNNIAGFIDYTSSTLSGLEVYSGLDGFFVWKSVIFGAKARLLLSASEFDYAYFWCFRALEEYLKSCIVKLDKANFYGETFNWNGCKVQGVTKLLKIFQDELSDSELHSKANDLYYYVKLRNASIIGHGTIRHSLKETGDFVFKVFGFIENIEKNSSARKKWLDRVKYVESLYKGEVYNVFLKLLHKEAEITQVFE